ncbi:neurogenic locus notch homolog protein 2-like [Anneissia japonica]|uniref:neurogenic locus notch homolog protein 2-like n=1 Tax=Anneissia japonica TaxID=1529436 RepID=UPI0014255C0C|nr:neurogenic locus notch homolog protein 2-like [Anneissia japonica]
MAIKGKDFKKAVTFIKEFLLKLPEDEDCAELRDGFNLVLLHMKKYFKTVWLRMQERQSSTKLQSSGSMSRALSPLTPYQDAPDQFQWKWVDLHSQKGLSKSLPSDGIQTMSLILQAAKEGDVELINQLLEKDTNRKDDVDALGRTALMYAVHFKQNECVTALLDHQADVNTQANDGSTALHRAVYDNNYTALEILLQYNPAVTIQDCYGRAPVHWASMVESSANMELLLRTDIDVNARDRDGLTPAMWACRMDNTRHLDLLLNCPSNKVEETDGIERDIGGRTWIHWAVRRTEPMECLKKLITPDTVAIRDNEGKTVLHVAAEQGSMEACKIILHMVGKSCLKETDNIHRTCLHLAVISGHGEVVNFLLEEGANLEYRDTYDATAMDYASNKNLHYCSLILNSFFKHKNKRKQRKKENQNQVVPEADGRAVGISDDRNNIGQRKLSNENPEINNNSAIFSRDVSPLPGEKLPKPPGKPRPLGRKITPPSIRAFPGDSVVVTEKDEEELVSGTPSAPPIEMEDVNDVDFADMYPEDDPNRTDADMAGDVNELRPSRSTDLPIVTEMNEDGDTPSRKGSGLAQRELFGFPTSRTGLQSLSMNFVCVLEQGTSSAFLLSTQDYKWPMPTGQSAHVVITPAIQVQPPYPPSSPPVRIFQPQMLNQQQVTSNPIPLAPSSMSSPTTQVPPPQNQITMHSMEMKPTPSPRTQLPGSGGPLGPAPLLQGKMQPLAQRPLLPLDGQPLGKQGKHGKKKKKKRSASEGALAIGPLKASTIEPINGSGVGGRVLGGITSPLQPPGSPRSQPKQHQPAVARPPGSQDSSPRSNSSWEVAWEPQVRPSAPAPPITPRESRDTSPRHSEMPNLIPNAGRRGRSHSTNEIDTVPISSQRTIDLNSRDATGRRHDGQSGFNSQGRPHSGNTVSLPRKPGNRNMTSGLPAPQQPGPRPLGI